jgi:hypothetical protein
MPGHRYHWARPPGPKSQPAMALVGVAMAVALAASACGSGAGSSSSKQTTSPATTPEAPTSGTSAELSSKPQAGLARIDPKNFTLPVDNPYFPLKPGTTYRHEGDKEGKPAVIVYTVTDQTKQILGVTNVVVVDKLYVNGRIEEIAHDWYAQDRQGNVWYFGETIKEYDAEGRPIPAKGAWQAGVDGAKPGIVMPAKPTVGQIFRPEFYKGKAEDRYKILDLSATVRTPHGVFSDVLVMSEQTRLEPGVLGLKYHARGFGQIKESVAKGPHETLSLVSVNGPRP